MPEDYGAPAIKQQEADELIAEARLRFQSEDVAVYDDAKVIPVEGGFWVEAYLFISDSE